MTEKETGQVLYNGKKQQFIVPEPKGKAVLVIKGEGENREWEEIREVECLTVTPENIANDFRMFVSNAEVCAKALYKAGLMIYSKPTCRKI